MNTAATIRRDYADVIAAAETRAVADVQIGITNLEAELATCEDWQTTGTPNGRGHHIIPQRQMLNAGLRRIRAMQ